MFSPARLSLSIRAIIQNDGKVRFREDTVAMFKHLAVEDLLPDHAFLKRGEDGDAEPKSSETSIEQTGVDESCHGGGDDDLERTFEVQSVVRADGLRDGRGHPIQLPTNLWHIRDVGTLEIERPRRRRDRAEKRLVELTFKTRALSQALASRSHAENLALYEALLEQAEIQLRVLVEKKCLAVLKIKPVISFKKEPAPVHKGDQGGKG